MGLRYGYLTLIFTFLLGCHDGFVALWIPPAKEPAVVFPYAVTSLPPADQKRLQEGIEAETNEALTSLLEDYLS